MPEYVRPLGEGLSAWWTTYRVDPFIENEYPLTLKGGNTRLHPGDRVLPPGAGRRVSLPLRHV